ncbi:hypothetical protein NPIL_300241 [Nephila pilipes]|uniref:Uncharacterized protein n=1 Tax=Nephila pilipes TaxID=299642 RepID=A0A8X6TE21_NEPPI|nr:hypothetical protein NPIL_300241 [Nephila pilipes]
MRGGKTLLVSMKVGIVAMTPRRNSRVLYSETRQVERCRRKREHTKIRSQDASDHFLLLSNGMHSHYPTRADGHCGLLHHHIEAAA